MSLTMKNLSPQMHVFTLEHESLKAAGPPYGYVVQTGATVDVDPTNGARHPRPTRKTLPSTLTFLAGETKSGLPNVIKLCPHVAQALKPGGVLRIITETTDEEPPPKPAPTSIAVDLDPLKPAAEEPFVQIAERPRV